MRQSRDSLHLDSVALIEWVVQNTWRVDYLPARVLVVAVTHEQVLGGEGIRLHINVGIGDIVDEGGLADVGEARHDQSSRVCVDRWQPAQMLSDFFQVAQTGLELFDQGARATQSCALQLLCAIQGVSVLEQANVVVGDAVADALGLVDVAEGELVVIAVVEHVHQVGVEGVDVVQLREPLDDSCQLLIDSLLHELDFAHVELADSLDLEALTDLGRRLTLRFRQHDVDQIAGLRDLHDLLEVVRTLHHQKQSLVSSV